MKMSIFISLVAVLLSACTITPPMPSTRTQAIIEQNPVLVADHDTRFEYAFFADKERLQRFKKISFLPLELDQTQFDERRLQPRERGWSFTEQEQQHYIEHYLKSAARIFNDGSALSFTDQPDETTVFARMQILSFSPNAPKDTPRSRPNKSEYLTYGTGTLTMAIQLHDAETKDVLAVFEDTQELGDLFRLELNDRFNNNRNFRLELDRWLNKLERTL